MRTPEFKTTEMKWDEFKKFHNNIGNHMFVKFDDGSFMIRNNHLRIKERKTYHEYGFRIVRSNDPVCRGAKFYDPDGNRITARSLGNCELLWDIDTNKAYNIEAMWTPSRFDAETRTREDAIGPNKTDLLPNYIRNHGHRIRFFMHGDGRIVTMPVSYNVWREYDKEQETYLKTITNACKAWHQMCETKDPSWRFQKQNAELLNWRGFNDLIESERRGIAIWGFVRPIDTKHTSHLIIEKK